MEDQIFHECNQFAKQENPLLVGRKDNSLQQWILVDLSSIKMDKQQHTETTNTNLLNKTINQDISYTILKGDNSKVV